jgi:tRNA A-37 threonylcarbamoyl transferase component Bud32
MTGHPGELLASGRAADVYDLGDGTVLRRYRSAHDVTVEGRLMTWLADEGVAVPRVHRADGADLVMDLVRGPTMLDDLGRRPWMLASHARTLARMQRSLGALDAPAWLPSEQGVADGRSVLHLDLHPMNVILGPTGPVVIDWTNARRGASGFDAATSYVLMATFDTAGLRDRVGQRILVAAFAAWRGRSEIRRHLAAACDHRLHDANVTPAERQAVERLRPA